MNITDFDDWYASGQRFKHHGHAIFYRVTGGGAPALLLIHGFPTASWDWHKVWPALSEKFPCLIAADMIGFGYSAKPRDYSYSIQDQADLHEELLRGLGIRHYHILGHDIGDAVAQELLARRLEGSPSSELLSICLLNGGLFSEAYHPRLIQRLLASPIGALVGAVMYERGFHRGFQRIFGNRTRPNAMELHEFWRLIRHDYGTAILHKLIGYIEDRRRFRERWVGALQRADVPLRFVAGAADPISGAEMVARYRELVLQPDAVELTDIGHYPQLEAPEAVLAAFLDFHGRFAPEFAEQKSTLPAWRENRRGIGWRGAEE